MTVRIYRSTDTDAPDMSNKPSSERGDLIALLKAVLVDGYGAQPPAGWTMPFEDAANDTAVFKNSEVGPGTGTYFRIDDGLSYQYAGVRGYSHMTDVDTGTNPFPTTGQATNGHFLAKRRSANRTDIGTWTIIACERSFYYMVQVYHSDQVFNNNQYGWWYLGFIGDIASYISSDPYCAVIAAEASATSVDDGESCFDHHSTMASDGAIKYMQADHTGFNVSVPYAHFCNTSITGESIPGQYSGGTSYLLYPDPITSRTIFGKMYVAHFGGIRGEYPGCMFAMNGNGISLDEALPQDGQFAGEDWWVMGIKDVHTSIYPIKYNCTTEDWYNI